MIISAYLNDEILGCGGTIAKHVKSSDKVYLIFMTNYAGSHKEKRLNIRSNKARQL